MENNSKPQNTENDAGNIGELRRAVLQWLETAKAATIKRSPVKPAVKINAAKKNPPPVSPLIKSAKPHKRHWAVKSLLSLVGLVLGIMVLFGLVLYLGKGFNPVISAVTRVMPYPAAMVNYHIITYGEWGTNLEALNNFYQISRQNNSALAEPSLAEKQKQVLDRLIGNQVLNLEGEKFGLAVTGSEVDSYVASLEKNFKNGGTLAQQLQYLYGWSVDDFKKNIVRPLLLKNKLAVRLLDEQTNQEALVFAQQILAEIKSDKISFEAAAKKYSADASGSQGGDLGFISRGQLLQEIDAVAFNLELGEVSPIIKSPLGFHIIRVTGRLLGDTGEVNQVRLEQILIPGANVDNYLKTARAKSRVWSFLIF